MKTAPRLTPGVKVPIPQGLKTRPGFSQALDVQADRVVELRDEKLEREKERNCGTNEDARGSPAAAVTNGATKTSLSGVSIRALAGKDARSAAAILSTPAGVVFVAVP